MSMPADTPAAVTTFPSTTHRASPTTEVLVMTGRVFDRIIDPDASNTIEEVIAEGEYYGMQTFDQSLFSLYKNGLVALRDALAVCSHPHDFRLQLQQEGLATTF